MFSLRRKNTPAGLLTSRLYNEQGFYLAFVRDLKQSRREVIIESPYMTTNRISALAPILKMLVKDGVKVRVNTRHPNHHDEPLRSQGWLATEMLDDIGAEVWHYNNLLHRKVAVIDGQVVWEGSLNILSQKNSCEFMRRIESPQLALELIRFLGLRKVY